MPKPSKSSPESAVYERYASAADRVEPALCCPVEYSADFLSVIPEEILERDYGCGDPSPFVKEGETVLDLGSGGGKLCYIIAQVVGNAGRVIGVDCNAEMLSLARRHQPVVADNIGYDVVDFRYGMIQDLALDLDLLGRELEQHAVRDPSGWLRLRALEDRLRREQPLIADESIDCVVSNCVLNLVRKQDRRQLFREVFRVLRNGGRAAISDIVCDEAVPEHLQNDPTLWSGCLSGAFREDEFLSEFEAAGFHGVEIVKRQREPWQTVEGIEFRSMTVLAYKGKQGPCLEKNQAVVYRGPFRRVEDDDGHFYIRGARMAVCEKTFKLLQREPYLGMFDPIEPREAVTTPESFDCRRSRFRDPRETKGAEYRTTSASDNSCTDEPGCC